MTTCLRGGIPVVGWVAELVKGLEGGVEPVGDLSEQGVGRREATPWSPVTMNH
jgi:hypothetical protein